MVKFATKNKLILERYPNLEKDVPYIFVSTHTFTEDIIATIQKLDRNAYVLIGTTDQMDYNPQMYAAWVNGMIYVDRYNKESRRQAIDKMEFILNNGTSVLIFAEGGYNNTDNLLCQKLFNSPYYLAQKTGYDVVPIASFNEHNSGVAHITVGNPIRLYNQTKEEFMEEIRQKLAEMQFEHLLNFSTPLKRKELGEEPRFDFMDERIQEYKLVQWSGSHILDEELVEYYDKENPTPKQLRATLQQINLTKENAYIMVPIINQIQEDKKYDLKTYMKKIGTVFRIKVNGKPLVLYKKIGRSNRGSRINNYIFSSLQVAGNL